jgi:hypothetical protein
VRYSWPVVSCALACREALRCRAATQTEDHDRDRQDGDHRQDVIRGVLHRRASAPRSLFACSVRAATMIVFGVSYSAKGVTS